jgi:hypothetical protein
VFAETTVELHLLLNELRQHLMVPTPFGFGDQDAQLALTAFEIASLEGMQSVFDLFG